MLQPLHQFGTAGANALTLLVQLRARNGKTLQGCGSPGLRLTQFRQFMRADSLIARGFHLRFGHIANGRGRLRQRALRLGLLPFGHIPAQVQQGCFGAADICGKRFEAIGLACLAFQAFNLAAQFAHHIIQPLQIGFSRAQPQFRLMAARVQAGNARRLFQKRTARLRFCLYQLADTPLPHHGRRARTGGLIGK